MVKLTRQHQKVFGKDHNLGEVKKFGSLAAGAPANALTPEEVQSLSKYTDGWFASILGANSPTIQDRNALDYVFGYQLAYLMEAGVAEWNILTTYYIGGIVNVGGKLYKSLTDNNLNNLVTDGSSWEEIARDESLLSLPKNLILSGKTRASGQPQFIKPNGAAASFTIEGFTTNLIYYVNNSKGTISTDIVGAGLTLAPAANNTCLVNDVDATGQESTRTWGEIGAEKEYILIDTIGTEISNRVGEWACFKQSTEYFIGFIEADRISKILRGYFTDSAGAPINRAKFSNNATVTIMSTAWIFGDKDGLTVDVTYENPIWSAVEPATPSVGDYWFNSVTEIWEEYDGANYADSEKTILGIAIIDTANCVAAKSFDFHGEFSGENNIEVTIDSVSVVKIKEQTGSLSVYGKRVNLNYDSEGWDIASNLAIAADMYNSAEQASTTYYLYVDRDKKKIVSDISPQNRKGLCGHYHPHNPWKCVGEVFNDSSLNFLMCDEIRYNRDAAEKIIYISDVKANGVSGGASSTLVWVKRDLNTVDGDSEFLSLLLSQLHLMRGEYKIDAVVPSYNGDRFKGRIYNASDSKTEIEGATAHSINTAAPSILHAPVKGILKIYESKKIELQFISQSGVANGLGLASVDAIFGNEVYSILKISKIR